MNNSLGEAQDVFLNGVNQICNKFGLNNIMAQLYVILNLNNKPLSLNEMAEQLKISKASASINIRTLERYGAVRRIWVKGSRKDYYEAEMDISKVITDRIKSIVQSRLSEVENMINSSYQVLNSISPSDLEEEAAIKVFRQKLDRLKDLRGKAQSLFSLYNTGLLSNLFNSGTNGSSKTGDLVLK